MKDKTKVHIPVLGYSLSQLLEYSFPPQSCAHLAFVWLHCMSGCSGVVMLRWYQRKGQCPLANLLAIFSVPLTLLGGQRDQHDDERQHHKCDIDHDHDADRDADHDRDDH